MQTCVNTSQPALDSLRIRNRIMDIIIIVLEIVSVNTARVVSVEKVVALNNYGLALQLIRKMLIVNVLAIHRSQQIVRQTVQQ